MRRVDFPTILVFFSTDGIPNFVFFIAAMILFIVWKSFSVKIEDYVVEFFIYALTAIFFFVAAGVARTTIAISRDKARVQSIEQDVLIDEIHEGVLILNKR